MIESVLAGLTGVSDTQLLFATCSSHLISTKATTLIYANLCFLPLVVAQITEFSKPKSNLQNVPSETSRWCDKHYKHMF